MCRQLTVIFAELDYRKLMTLLACLHLRYVNHDMAVLWCCWLVSRKGIQPLKTECWGAGVVICLGQPRTGYGAVMFPDSFINCLLAYLNSFLLFFLIHLLPYLSDCLIIDPFHFQVRGRKRWPNLSCGR